MLSISLCGVRPQNPWRITLLAKFTPHSHNAGPVSGTRAQRRFRLAGPLLRAFRLAARRRVRSPDRPLRSPRPGRALLRGPPPDRHRIVRAGCRRVAPVRRGLGACPPGPASVAVAGLLPASVPGCWNSDCGVRFGSHCSWHRAGPFLTHVRGRTGKPCQPATPISLPRRHFWLRCGCLPGPDRCFPAGASLRPSMSQMLRTHAQNNGWIRDRLRG